MRIYLAGAMDLSPDGGIGWRRQISPMLWDVGLETFNPCVEGDGFLARILDWQEFSFEKWNQLKIDDYESWADASEEVADLEMNALINSDGLLVYYDNYARTKSDGTPGEITIARLVRLPTAIVFGPGVNRQNCGLWITGCTRRATFYDTMDDFIKVMHLVGKDKKQFFPKQLEKVML